VQHAGPSSFSHCESSQLLRIQSVIANPASSPSKRFEEHLIKIAPAPILAGFEGFNNRMSCVVEMPGRVPVGGIVATPYVAAIHAEAKMQPGGTDFQTIFTTVRARRDLFNLIQMRAGSSHLILPLSFMHREQYRRITYHQTAAAFFCPEATAAGISLTGCTRPFVSSQAKSIALKAK
jgi:hypothetical protein